MNDDIRVGGSPELPSISTSSPKLFPMRVGDATVFVEQISEPPSVEGEGIYPVALPGPQEVFGTAIEALRECVRLVGDGIGKLAVKPQQMSIEFYLTFEAKGQASLVPVFVTGQVGGTTGLKVTATWEFPTD